MDHCFINPDWRERLGKLQLNTLDDALAFDNGEKLSVHPRRGRMLKAVLEDGTAIFLKTDNFTYFKQVCKDLWNLKRPTPNSVKERQAYDFAAAAGIRVPEVIAWWTRSTLGYPGAAAMVTLPLAGEPLNQFLAREKDEAKRRSALQSCEAVLLKLAAAGGDWPDAKPEHFFLDGDSVGLIDLERLRICPKSAVSPEPALARLRRMSALIVPN